MLWKYKKCYQETNEEVVNPKICVGIVSAEFNSILNVNSIGLSYTTCDGLNTGDDTAYDNIVLPINKCIQLETLAINNELLNLTVQQINDAIDNNNGLVNIPLLDSNTQDLLGSTTIVFDNCNSSSLHLALRTEDIDENTCSGTLTKQCRIATQVTNEITSGDIMYNAFTNTTFNGGGLYYRVVLSIWGQPDGSRVCQISSSGVINIYSICV